MNSSIQFRTMAKSFWKLPLDLKKEKREREKHPLTLLDHLFYEAHTRSSIPSKIHSPEFRKLSSALHLQVPPFLSIKTAENSVQRLNGGRGKPGRNEGADSSSWPKSGCGEKSGWPREKKLNRTQGSDAII